MAGKSSAGYENKAFSSQNPTDTLTLKYIDVFKETCLPNDAVVENIINNKTENVNKSKSDNMSTSVVSNTINTDYLFQNSCNDQINNSYSNDTIKGLDIIVLGSLNINSTGDISSNNNTNLTNFNTKEEEFKDIQLRPTTSNESPKTVNVRPVTEMSRSEKPLRKSNLWKRTLRKATRRHTTPVGLTEKELKKLNISGPSNLHIIDVSDTQKLPFSRDSIQDCPFNISGYGDLILTDDFKVSKPRKMVLTTFLFEKIIIFTKANEDESYYYVGSIIMENVSLEPPSKSTKELIIKDYANSVKFKKDITFTLTALSENTQTKWRQCINRCLWSQFLRTKEQKEKEDI